MGQRVLSVKLYKSVGINMSLEQTLSTFITKIHLAALTFVKLVCLLHSAEVVVL